MNGGTAKIEVWHLHGFPVHFWLFSRVASLRFRGKCILCCCNQWSFPIQWSWDEFSSWVHMEAGDVVLTHRAFATRDLVICKRDMHDIGQGLSITENCTSSCKAKTKKKKETVRMILDIPLCGSPPPDCRTDFPSQAHLSSLLLRS